MFDTDFSFKTKENSKTFIKKNYKYDVSHLIIKQEEFKHFFINYINRTKFKFYTCNP